MSNPVVTPSSLTFNSLSVGGGPNQSVAGSVQSLSVTSAGYTGSFSISALDASIVFFGQASNNTTQPVVFWVYAYQAGSTSISVSDQNGNVTTIPVTVTLPIPPTNIAGGYNASQAISMCYLRTNANANSISQQNVLTLLNASIGEISDSLGPVKKFVSIPTAATQNVINLPYDVQDVVSASFSTLAPAGAGTQVYRLEQLEQNTFMDFSGGLPGTGFGPPLAFMIVSDINGYQTLQLYPPAFAGFLNLYYRSRPQTYADISQSSTTNMDPQAQELMIYWTCARICEAQERYQIAGIFQSQFDKNLEESRDIIRRRTAPKTGQVRDVTSSGSPGTPPWWNW
jgi:hypothetical protein